ncbi:NAD(P)/FAD-dependent oxidoreductase [Mycolicibacterium sphagni]|uniref:NAD(P)/FAD-dependent oxidoreductase n=1 Tax=Mycolicibacterium sphagni TaxID=1786 RepID=UPI0021F2EE7E|nr:FAD-dependent oxidoreductase [Mycolicibacterium sphagni]MCV7177070.1 FAD-dependent oxidoreductase [Mycolicibacterium sphagni]
MSIDTVVVVGSSVAGVRTARALRTEGYAGGLVLVGQEAELPYDKPPLSKQYLSGAFDDERITLLTADEARAADIELRLGAAATGINTGERLVRLADGTQLAYDALVIATGADARPSPWAARSGVHVVRTRQHSSQLAAALATPGPIVVVGGGFIGAEVAATARAAGHTVTVIDPNPAPMSRAVGEELGALLAGIHRRHGVDTRFGHSVRSVVGTSGALDVTLDCGEVLAAATVVVGIGAVPADGWLAGSGVVVDDGVVCDEFCRAVGHSNIFAAGDVARWLHLGHGERIRVEHWTNAAEQAACVAHNLTRPDDLRAYRPTEYVWSDQYGWKIQIAGHPNRGVLHRLIGDFDVDEPRVAALFCDDRQTLCGVVTVNWPRALVTCRQLVASGGVIADAVDAVSLLPAVRAVRSAPG